MSRVTIRPLRVQDAFTSYLWRNDKEVFALTTVSYESEITLETELEWIQEVLSHSNELRYAIEVDGEYVGNIYLTGITSEEGYYHVFIGNKSYWGKGVAYEASLQLLQYAFDTLGLKRVLLDVRANNHKAIHLYRKLGFVETQSSDSIYRMVLPADNFLLPQEPVVSVICLTYNQQKYVRDCLNGFVEQQTSFPFEVLVYDDASTDGTADIIMEYKNSYPDIFRVELFKENNFSKGKGYVGFYNFGIKVARGKYVAYCEGDDYWTDPLKLQKQVDFLEAHPQYVICAHETIVKDENPSQINGQLYSDLTNNLFISTKKRHYSFYDTFTGNIFHVSSLMYKNRALELPKWLPSVSACDMILYMLLAREGDMFVFPEAMSVYRGHSDSLTSSRAEYGTAIKFHLLSIRILRLMNRFWNRQYQAVIYPIISRYYVECSMNYLRRSHRSVTDSKRMARLAWNYSNSTAVVYLFKGFVNIITSYLCRR